MERNKEKEKYVPQLNFFAFTKPTKQKFLFIL
jgi:hypothetical protein